MLLLPLPVTTDRWLPTDHQYGGCDPGNSDGNWDDRSRRALALFSQNAKTNSDIEIASQN
jgi:hypothetical protein